MKKSTQKSKFYITHSLNEAVYLVYKGLKYKLNATGNVTCKFSFPQTPLLERYRREFFMKGCKIEVHTWLAIRQSIKDECKAQGAMIKNAQQIVSLKNVSALPIKKLIVVGEQYWYIENDLVKAATFGGADIHKERIAQGNCFSTRDEAVAYRVATNNK